MTLFERAFRKASRTVSRWNYEYERRKRQRQIQRAIRTVFYRNREILAAKKSHGKTAPLYRKSFIEMTDMLRMENAANDCARMAMEDVRNG